MGTAFTSTNIKSLSAQTIVLALDNDSAGMKSMYTYIVNNPPKSTNYEFIRKGE